MEGNEHESKYLGVGADAIQYRMHNLGFSDDDTPSTSTINRIVKKHKLKVNKRERYKRVRSKKRYTLLNHTRINEMHQMDFVGPRFIKEYGAISSLNLIDVVSNQVHIELDNSKSMDTVIAFLIQYWSNNQIPRYLQVDNGMNFIEAHLHKFRRAMVRPDRERLKEQVEVDETYVGGREEGLIERVRLRGVPDVSEDSLIPFVCEMVEQGSIVHTDGWSSYISLSKLGYKHKRTILSATGDPAHVSMHGVHRLSSLLKRWILGTLHGSIRAQQLDYYLDEYTFRFNRRTSRSRGMLFYRLIEQSVSTGPNPYKSMVGGGKC